MNKLAIMQPYFFPYVGYFQLINYADTFVLFDVVQYKRHAWINRNKVLRQEEGWDYVTLPLKKHGRDTLIKDIKLSNNKDWRQAVLGRLAHYKKTAPYYKDVVDLVNHCFAMDDPAFVPLLQQCLQGTCNYIGVPHDIRILSEDQPNATYDVTHPGEWALEVSKHYKAKEYINPLGGAELFDIEQFNKSGIEFALLEPVIDEYDQHRAPFIGGLSILDVLMFNSPKETKELLHA